MRRVHKIENLQSRIDGILVRPVRADDAADLYAIISQPEVSRTLVYAPSIEFADTLNTVPHLRRRPLGGQLFNVTVKK